MVLDLVQNSPPKVKIPTPIIIVEKNSFFNKRIGPLPLGENLPAFYICMRIIVIFFCFRSYLFLHALLARAPQASTHISSAVTLREFRARSVQCVARGKLLKLRFCFLLAVADKKNPRGFAYFRSGFGSDDKSPEDFFFFFLRT